MKKRFIYSDNETLMDSTEVVNNYHSGDFTFSYITSEDAIYIGSSLPFNHLYIKLGSTVNAETSNMIVNLWDGKEWNEVAELIDGTEVEGITLSQSGFIEFVPDKNEGWSIDDTVTPSNKEEVIGLGDIIIYDKYWMKITFSADLTEEVVISWIGQIFSDDNDLEVEFPDLTRSTMISATTGNSNWEPQHVRSAQLIIKDLKIKGVIENKNQILNRDDLTLPSVSKVAEIIYGMLGDDYADDRNKAKKEYTERLSSALPVIDINNNARVDVKEVTPSNGILYR